MPRALCSSSRSNENERARSGRLNASTSDQAVPGARPLLLCYDPLMRCGRLRSDQIDALSCH
jgi:hypothetical protein